jgi:hypothetical protein
VASDAWCLSCGAWRCACRRWQPASLEPSPASIHELVCPCCSEAGNADLLELTFEVAADEELGAVTVRIPELQHELTLAPDKACDVALRLVGCASRARRALLRSLGARPGS